MSPTYITVPK